MDYSSNAIEIIPEATGPELWAQASDDQAVWATEDDYRSWKGEPSADTASNPAYGDRQSQTKSRAGGEQPPSKKPRDSLEGNGSMSKSRAIGKMFFKTKLCCKFRAGTCPYITNCNFAHGMEELRKPPPNWQEIVAAQEEGAEPREEHQIPILTSSSLGGDGQRSYKGRHCKKFYTEEGCPYGDMCTFLHDEQSKARESVAISLSPTVGGGGYGGGSNGSTQKPSNWKTRICNKWEMTGYCPFGSKCHFAHGAAELHRYGGGLVEMEGRDASSAAPDSKQAGVSTKAPADNAVASVTSVPHVDVYHMGVPSQRSTIVNQRQGLSQGQRTLQKWKGPDKISRIYGDWIEENE
ncbi:zinc finger CCCH domain-containing protein 56-like isoform X2 [Phoenix dactylifera]|uniref:Zinc finger CCCH domain-containing protein 56-like isoform X2 n=1 Tax=Phoenix dactylifera TaxID=42345 RepID=A0A8B7BZQ6_PHODC|nr:zinc finger CCCH domain-containing protein 56-like isoform X2 [Phoenix dactylifera]